jgi:citrate lyase subunit beta / citryl-CoA lyase
VIPITGIYVPGNRPDRFDKAVGTGADLVILDLEDAVPRHEKSAALSAVVGWLGRRTPTEGPLLQVRVNPHAAHEIAALRATGVAVEIRLPKVESSAEIAAVNPQGERELPVTALIESARGVERISEIVSAAGLTRVAMGEADLQSELGSTSETVLDYARMRVLFATRAAGLPAPMLSVYPRIRDLDGLAADTERGRAAGFVGRVAVHPSQLEVIRRAFVPSEGEVAWAQQVVDALRGGGVATLASGEMVDPAMLPRATAILDRAGSPPSR